MEPVEEVRVTIGGVQIVELCTTLAEAICVMVPEWPPYGAWKCAGAPREGEAAQWV
jgi:hypothetical protein